MSCLHRNCLSRGNCLHYRPVNTEYGRAELNNRPYSPWIDYHFNGNQFVDVISPEARAFHRTYSEVRGDLSSQFNKCHVFYPIDRTGDYYDEDQRNITRITLYEIERGDFE